MTVFVVSTVDFPEGGAESAHVHLMVKGLRENGERAFLLIPHGQGVGRRRRAPHAKGTFQGTPFLHVNGRRIRPSNRILRFLQNYGCFMRTARLVSRRIRRKRLDAVILYNPDTLKCLPLILCCIMKGCPLFIWAVEKMTLEHGLLGLQRLMRRTGFWLSENWLPRFSAGAIVISTLLERHYGRILPGERIHLSPIMVNPRSPTAFGVRTGETGIGPGLSPGPSAVYSGSFAEKDGVPVILRAFAMTASRFPHLRLFLTGAAPRRVLRRLETQIDRLHLRTRVTTLGFLSRDDLSRLQQQASVLLLCRRNSAFARHGLAWKLGEYALTGRPILATRVGDIDLYFKDREHLCLVSPDDPAAIAAGLRRILVSPVEAAAMGRRARKRAVSLFHYLPITRGIAEFLRRTTQTRA